MRGGVMASHAYSIQDVSHVVLLMILVPFLVGVVTEHVAGHGLMAAKHAKHFVRFAAYGGCLS